MIAPQQRIFEGVKATSDDSTVEKLLHPPLNSFLGCRRYFDCSGYATRPRQPSLVEEGVSSDDQIAGVACQVQYL